MAKRLTVTNDQILSELNESYGPYATTAQVRRPCGGSLRNTSRGLHNATSTRRGSTGRRTRTRHPLLLQSESEGETPTASRHVDEQRRATLPLLQRGN